MNKLTQMLNHQARLHYDQGAFGLSELFKNATNEILALHEENERLKAALETIANWQDADKDQVDFCMTVLKELSND